MKFFLIFVSLIFLSLSVYAKDKIYNLKPLTNFYMNPEKSSPIIYPIELGYEMFLEKKNGDWYNVRDNNTGLLGWVFKDDFGNKKPSDVSKSSDFDKSFLIFKEKVIEMSKSIEDAIGVKTFTDVKHIGGVAAKIIADDDWFKGRRHQNQAFQVYEIWKNQNQSPSFLSFRNDKDEEQFIVLSGPHRPRYLRSSKK